MQLNSQGIALIRSFEKFEPQAYLCPAGCWTLGWGNTRWENGRPVKPGETITRERAERLFHYWLDRFSDDVRSLLKVKVNENQFSALVSFAYNVGSDIDADDIAEGLGDSTLLKRVNANPSDPAIAAEFAKWKRSNGHVLNGLVRRRAAEATLYFL
ncbi:lysozyme [Catalinimonas alkaloidigena]|uniref:Lysozyme n=1 Tax=Catalinimonas alkaloidigena TaxID=1075417 RepID=A0A1G9B612_9BACT|nr:lysozyme [Catalinimonas alkaloidigena]SDK34919.1 lysozyme [Catalinimonas alkaloidigena]